MMPSDEPQLYRSSCSTGRPVKERARSPIGGQPTRVRSLSGTVVVAFLIAGSRWGAHIGAGPIYLTDIFLGAALFHRMYGWHVYGRRPKSFASQRSSPGLILGVFLAWVALRALMGVADLSLVFLRDLAPYAYAVVGIFSAFAYSRSSVQSRHKTASAIRWALVFHLLWLLAVELLPSVVSLLPGSGGETGLFSLRRDFDGAMVGVLGGMTAFRMLLGRANRLDYALLVGCGVALALIQSRAALLGSIAAVGVAVWSTTGRSARIGRGRAMLNATALILIVAALLIAAPSTSTGARLVATLDPSSAHTEAQLGALGTAGARWKAWGHLKGWVEEAPSRQLIGVGFGPDFLHASGTDLLLLNRQLEEVRSPHNFLLGTYARLGTIGVVLWSILCLQVLTTIWRRSSLFQSEPLLLIAAMISAALVPAGLLGVIFESPFGAIPFYWCVGILLCHPIEQRHPEADIRESQSATRWLSHDNHAVRHTWT